MPKQHQPDYAAELEKDFARWDYLYEHGGRDPGYADGVGLNLVRRHIMIDRGRLEDNPTLFGFPACYYREIPPEVDPGYMARPDEIRAAARASLEAYHADPDYQYILSHRDEIPPKLQDKMYIGAVLGYVSGLEHAIAEDDLVAMRRHESPAGYLDSFESCARRMQEFLSDGIDSADAPAPDEQEDEDIDDCYGEECGEGFDEEAEQGFGGMTMRL